MNPVESIPESDKARAQNGSVLRDRIMRYLMFCVVGGSGVLVDMGVLHVLASPGCLGWNLCLSKGIAAEVAILNNFWWNDRWTFRDLIWGADTWGQWLGRLGWFNGICLTGIMLSVLLLNLQVHVFGWNLYVSNLVAIVIVSLWNFLLNLRYGWAKL